MGQFIGVDLTRELGELPESVRGENNFWTYICSLSCIARAFSYYSFPPESETLSAKSAEALVPYSAWVWWLLGMGAILFLGAVFQSVRTCFLGHILATLTYSFFTYSLTFAIVLINLDIDKTTPKVGWAGVPTLAVVAILNGWRVWKLGKDLRPKLEKKA